jgi:hypothetical protein
MEDEWQDEDENDSNSQGSEHSHNSGEDGHVDPDNDNADDRSEHLSEASDLTVHPEFDMARESRDDTRSMFGYYENHSYDPDKITFADVQWLDRARVLAINSDLKSTKKAFWSGRGRSGDYVSHSHHLSTFENATLLIVNSLSSQFRKQAKTLETQVPLPIQYTTSTNPRKRLLPFQSMKHASSSSRDVPPPSIEEQSTKMSCIQ